VTIDINSSHSSLSNIDTTERGNTRRRNTFDKDVFFLLGSMLSELKKINRHLAALTDEEDINDED
jgi:hypothetical protein